MKRKFTARQKAKLNKIVRYYRNRNRYNGVTSVRARIDDVCAGIVAIAITTRRSDCDRYSPRQVLTAQEAYLFVGPRGGITVASARACLADEREFIANVFNARIQK